MIAKRRQGPRLSFQVGEPLVLQQLGRGRPVSVTQLYEAANEITVLAANLGGQRTFEGAPFFPLVGDLGQCFKPHLVDAWHGQVRSRKRFKALVKVPNDVVQVLYILFSGLQTGESRLKLQPYIREIN